jgi:RNA polymerase sigma-70 factor (ECF subfamily)
MKEQATIPAGSSQGDAALVKAFQGGDNAAFDKLVLRHKDKLFNLIYWFLGDYQEANDYSQETFIKVFKSLKKFRFESSFSTWLYRIAINTCKNRLKSSAYQWKNRTVPLEKPAGSTGGNPHLEIQDDSPSPVMELEERDRMKLIQAAINSLPEEQNRVVVLRDIQGLSYEEIAEITNQKLGTVKSRLARARLELRNKLMGRI